MEMEDVKVGQRVLVVSDTFSSPSDLVGQVGVVVIPNSGGFVGVDFGKVIDGFTHRLDGLLARLTGYFLRPSSLKLDVDEGFGKVGKVLLPIDAKKRKEYPIATGVLDYFPSALLEVARVSFIGNQQHNPGQPLHWARGKSTDQDDTIIRHFLERDGQDADGTYHLAKAAWRILALLQLKLEAEGAPIARGARLPEEKK